MEKMKEFLSISYGSGYSSGNGSGCGYGDGYSSGYGDGNGYGSGNGSGCGYGYGYSSGYGDGNGYGSGNGSGCGYGYGYGEGNGYGSGDGSGYGDGDGSGIKNYNGNAVYRIDRIATIIKKIRNNIAKGFILENDLTLTPCYVAKGHNLFAHGETIEKAVQALREKIFANMDTDETIETFLKNFELNKKYPAKDFYIWHNRLTGSCEMGRNQFIKEHGFDLENDTFTVQEFIKITRDSFGGDIIRQLEQVFKERKPNERQ